MSRLRVKKGDMVVAVRGANKGKVGKVLQVLPGKGRALVEGLGVVKKCIRKSQDHPQGGITEKESSISLANLMPYCPDCKKGVRIKHGRREKVSVRECGKCKHSFDD